MCDELSVFGFVRDETGILVHFKFYEFIEKYRDGINEIDNGIYVGDFSDFCFVN